MRIPSVFLSGMNDRMNIFKLVFIKYIFIPRTSFTTVANFVHHCHYDTRVKGKNKEPAGMFTNKLSARSKLLWKKKRTESITKAP